MNERSYSVMVVDDNEMNRDMLSRRLERTGYNVLVASNGKEALDLLKVKRIDHGVRCLKDEKLVQKLRDDQIPLTVCPLSNVKLCVFEKLEDHNLKKLLDKKLMVIVNSDDPAYFGGYLNTNLIECQKALNLSMEDVKKLAINSFKSSFLSEDEKKKWIDQINNLS